MQFFNVATETEGIVRSLEELLRRVDLERAGWRSPKRGGRPAHWPHGFDKLYGSWKGTFEEPEDPRAE